jgi:hypothetical protein
MRAKNNHFKWTIIIVSLVITTVAAIGWYFSHPQTPALAANHSVAQQPALEQQQPAVQPSAQPVSAFPLSQTANGITVELTSAKLIKTGIEIVICYPPPDAGEWYPTPGHIYYSTWEILPDEFELISQKKADGMNPGQNCEAIRYRIDDQASITLPIKFSLLGIHAVPREGSACRDLQTRLDGSPKAKAYGLKVNCEENEQGTRNATVTDHGASVSNAEAQKVLDEILASNVSGPWEFSIAALQK